MTEIDVQRGAVTFLDVLGWKGIWEKEIDALNILHSFVEMLNEKSIDITNQVASLECDTRGITTKVLSISDTIAIFTFGNPFHTIKIQSEICKMAVPESIKRKIPLRGAISFGEFSIKGNIMVGPAVDEAASWHESTDWIGVVLSPSAYFQLKDNFPNQIIKYSNIPFKKKIEGLDRCVNWDFSKDELYELFNDMGPYVPEIAPKYLNTLNFLNGKQA